ncbi:MAG: UDP-N-acetylmuramoyl-L-alanyl-D-glutamate--2,6-diaminopimelate ligase [Flaviflexus sp.]|nr:UDP-N-acetylmuramoyl-L-alanyl-D-glutamate--2,6-diaminopimelate ligase [Flaviflexus sp.]
MKLSELADLAEIRGDAELSGIASDNRKIAPGDLFAAVPGEHVHGARFAMDAVQRGAAAVLTDPTGASLVDSGVPLAIADPVAPMIGEASARIFGHPSAQLTSFAVTGTNGKTTTTFMIDEILARLGRTRGLIGTVTLRIAGDDVSAELTTPQPADLQRLLARLRDAGGTELVMEVSSHALSQGRTDPVRFTVAGFTNLTQDHLDFHHTLEDYFAAKATLFEENKSERAVIWTDDPWGARLADRHPTARWVGRNPRPGPGWLVSGGQSFTLTEQGGAEQTGEPGGVAGGESSDTRRTFSCHTDLPGDFNVANAALAAAMVLAADLEVGEEELAAALAEISPAVPGRMEVVSESPRVVVDFAHNAEALELAITSLRETCPGRIITVTGSAGDRDRGKRPIMGRVVAENSDVFYLTDDDPHGEDPAVIRADIAAGVSGPCRLVEIGDRARAIAAAIAEAGPDDTVFIAGRGHEQVQDMAGTPVELDDRVEARRALGEKTDD